LGYRDVVLVRGRTRPLLARRQRIPARTGPCRARPREQRSGARRTSR